MQSSKLAGAKVCQIHKLFISTKFKKCKKGATLVHGRLQEKVLKKNLLYASKTSSYQFIYQKKMCYLRTQSITSRDKIFNV